jgi:hypothetical protein
MPYKSKSFMTGVNEKTKLIPMNKTEFSSRDSSEKAY